MAWWRGSKGLYCGSPSASCSSRISPWPHDPCLSSAPWRHAGSFGVRRRPADRAVLASEIISHLLRGRIEVKYQPALLTYLLRIEN